MPAAVEDDLTRGSAADEAAETATLLEDVKQLYTPTGVHGTIALVTGLVLVRSHAPLAVGSYVTPGERWTAGHHLAAADGDCRDASPATVSAAFAVHRRLAHTAMPLILVRSDESEPIFRAFSEAGRSVQQIVAVPLLNRRNRLVGQVVLAFAEEDPGVGALLPKLSLFASLASGALENAERLAFAQRDQDRLRLLAEASEEALWDWDLQTDALWLGGGIGKVIRDEHEFIGATGRWKLDRIHPNDRAAVRSDLEAAIVSTASGWNREFRFRRGDGTWATVEDRGYFLRYEDGRAYRMIGTLRDVSEKRWTELQQRFLGTTSAVLAESLDVERNLQKAAKVAADTVADWCGIVLFSQGDDPAHVVAIAHGSTTNGIHDISDALEPIVDQLKLLAPGAAIVSAELPESWRQMVLDADPSFAATLERIAPISVLQIPIAGPDGAVGAVILVSSSDSARRYESADLAWAEEFARRCAGAIEKARLYEQAQNAIRARDAFMAILGHELRNPLSPITTALQLMKLRDPKSRREQEVIERQVKHLTRLVDDLLDVSRIERGKIELVKKPTQLAEVVAKAVEIASPLFEQRRHRLDLDVATSGLTIFADETRLAQVVANLLTNAARYTDSGGHVRVQAARDGQEIVLRVRDDGIGIPPDLIPRVFDLFVQGARTADRRAGGLGLGLSLVRSLVSLHGGHVEAHSDGPGLGSEFVVRLPAMPVELLVNEAAPALQSKIAPDGLRILVVDDNEDAAALLGDLLRAVGNTVQVANDGPTALAIAPEFSPDVAILDIGLPVMDGYELAQRLVQIMSERRPYLMALTGYGQEHDRTAATAAGFDAHMVKPIDTSRLMATLAEVRRLGRSAHHGER